MVFDRLKIGIQKSFFKLHCVNGPKVSKWTVKTVKVDDPKIIRVNGKNTKSEGSLNFSDRPLWSKIAHVDPRLSTFDLTRFLDWMNSKLNNFRLFRFKKMCYITQCDSHSSWLKVWKFWNHEVCSTLMSVWRIRQVLKYILYDIKYMT